MKTQLSLVIVFTGAFFGAALYGQDKITVPFSDSARPRLVKIHTLNGSIRVSGYSGKDLIVESSGAHGHRERKPPADAEGMKRIDPPAGLTIEQENNIVKINPGISGANVTVQVPYETSLELRALNNGVIEVENVAGEIDADNLNGGVTLRNVSGSVVAHSLNGKVSVSLDKVTPNKNMSFSTMNGAIDVTLPKDVKASVKMKTDNGSIYSDFDITLRGSAKPAIEDERSSSGKYRVRVDRAMYGAINGGGAEMQFVTFNGNIMIRMHK